MKDAREKQGRTRKRQSCLPETNRGSFIRGIRSSSKSTRKRQLTPRGKRAGNIDGEFVTEAERQGTRKSTEEILSNQRNAAALYKPVLACGGRREACGQGGAVESCPRLGPVAGCRPGQHLLVPFSHSSRGHSTVLWGQLS